MKRIEISILLVVDELGAVKVEKVDYVTRGKSDQHLFEGSTSASDLNITEETVTGPKLATSLPSAEILAMLAGLNLSEAEVSDYAITKTERRIRDVCSWIKNKNGVASPAGLARKLFAMQ